METGAASYKQLVHLKKSFSKFVRNLTIGLKQRKNKKCS